MSHKSADESAARRRIAELQQRHPLPPAWLLKDTLLQQITVGKLELQLVGLMAEHASEVALGAAAESEGFPIDRAWFELLERISVFDARRKSEPLTVRDITGSAVSQRAVSRVFPVDIAPERQRLAVSNGVALRESWQAACDAALCELVERDRVLRAWNGECAPSRLDPGPDSLARALHPHYRVIAYEFGVQNPAPRHRVAGLFLFPTALVAPLVYGFAAAYDAHVACARAEREALQRLAFLWGEPLPAVPPDPTPTPDFHQDYYLYPPHQARLRAWLETPRPTLKKRVAPLYDGAPVSFVDLTPAPLRERLSVAKAISPRARRLRFGLASHSSIASPHPIV
ncbi:MAG: YcaO-like family protein [Polyangiales bacterium]